MKKVSSVEEYIEKNEKYSEALSRLRIILNSTELEETLKWSAPVYCINGKNVITLAGFKNHFGLFFFNGVFLKDERNILEQAQETTKAMRHMKFGTIEEIDDEVVLSYVKEAIENQKLGKELKPTKTKASKIKIPDELNNELKADAELNKSYAALSPYKQKEYAEYINSAKRDKTKITRLEKIKPMIKKGIGLNDKYKNC